MKQRQPSQNTLACDVLVIGGGVIGLSIARELAPNYSVVLADKGKIGKKASWAAGGMLRPLSEWDGDDTLLDMCMQSFNQYPQFIKELEQETEISCELDTKGGFLLEYNPEKQEKARQHDITLRPLTSQQIKDKEPSLDAEYALYNPTDHHLNNRQLIRALAVSCKKRDVQLLQYNPLVQLIHDPLNENKVVGAVTRKATIKATVTIVCAGAWSSKIIHSHPITPIKGHMIRYMPSQPLLNHLVSFPPYYLIPRKDGSIIAGSTQEDVGFDTSLSQKQVLKVKQAVETVLPALKTCPIVEIWNGLRPQAQSQMPVIQKQLSGLVLATGHFRNGILLSPYTAKKVSTLVKEELAQNEITH